MPCNIPPPPIIHVEDDEMEVLDIIDTSEDTDDDIRTFAFHSEPVLCCRFDKIGSMAVTGGEDNRAIVFDIADDHQPKFIISGHGDSVIAADFNYDSTLVASASRDGIIQVSTVDSGCCIWIFKASEVTWLIWHPTSNFLFAGTINGFSYKWSIPDGATCCAFYENGAAAASCALLLDNGLKCVVGYQDGTIYLWDAIYSLLLKTLNEHEKGVLCLATSPDGALIASGAEDGTVHLINSSNFEVLHKWTIDEDTAIETLGFFKSHPFIAVGSSDGHLQIFDLSTFQMKSFVNLDDSIVKLICYDSSPIVYVACMNDVESYDGRSCDFLEKWLCHEDKILDLVFSPNQRNFLTTSGDKTCKLFESVDWE